MESRRDRHGEGYLIDCGENFGVPHRHDGTVYVEQQERIDHIADPSARAVNQRRCSGARTVRQLAPPQPEPSIVFVVLGRQVQDPCKRVTTQSFIEGFRATVDAGRAELAGAERERDAVTTGPRPENVRKPRRRAVQRPRLDGPIARSRGRPRAPRSRRRQIPRRKIREIPQRITPQVSFSKSSAQ